MYSNYPPAATRKAMEAFILNLATNGCNNKTGVKTAVKLINREPISLIFVKKIYSYLSRAKSYVDDPYRCGSISYNLWGGDPMLSWCKKILIK
jgi:hypothetical protein